MTAKYPLEEIAQIKQKRLEEAEKTLKEKKRLLDVEREKLKKAEEKRNLVKQHKQAKIQKFITEVDAGTTSDKIAIHERYLKKVVDEELQIEEKKVSEQKKVVKKAEEEVEKARKEYLKKNQEVEKLRLHKTEWDKEVLQEIVRVETMESDELGSSTHAMRKRRESKRGT